MASSKAQVQLSGDAVASLQRVSEARREQDQLLDRINKLHGHLANAAAADGARASGGVYSGGGERLRVAVDKYGERLEALYADVLGFAEMELSAAVAARAALEAVAAGGGAGGAAAATAAGAAAAGAAASAAPAVSAVAAASVGRDGARAGPGPGSGRDGAGGERRVGDREEGETVKDGKREVKTRGEKRGRASLAEPPSTSLPGYAPGEDEDADAPGAASSRRSGKKARRVGGISKLAVGDLGDDEEDVPRGGKAGRGKEDLRRAGAARSGAAAGDGDENPVDRDGHFLPGTEVAVCLTLPKKGEAVEFILCKVARPVPPSSYEVLDTDFDEESDSKPRKHTIPRSRVLGLNYRIPSARQSDVVLPAPPVLDHAKDSIVLALYPETSTMYKARVVSLPHRKKRTPPFEYQVEFDDDEDPDVVGIPRRRVDARYVIDVPPKFA